MDYQRENIDRSFLLVCIALGILAEICFFHGRIGISFLIFIVCFYIVFFFRFKFAFQHRRIGLLLTVVIWSLAGSYFLNDHQLFYQLNLIIIPFLMFSHIVLITSPKEFQWSTPHFVALLKVKFIKALEKNIALIQRIIVWTSRSTDRKKIIKIERVVRGGLLAIPLIITLLFFLMKADSSFSELMLFILRNRWIHWTLRFLLAMELGMLIYGIFQVLPENEAIYQKTERMNWKNRDVTYILPSIVLANLFLILFLGGMILKAGSLDVTTDGKDYLFIIGLSFIHLIVLVVCLKSVPLREGKVKYLTKGLYVLFGLLNMTLLFLAFIKLDRFEYLFGYSLKRVILYTLILLLFLMYTYALITIYIEGISILHFYLIIGLVIYTAVNLMNVEEVVVRRELERVIDQGEVNYEHFLSLSYPGFNGLIDLYEQGVRDDRLLEILQNPSQMDAWNEPVSWQSLNITREKVKQRYKTITFDQFMQTEG